MKKFRVVSVMILLLLVLPASLFSLDLIGLRVGPTAMLNVPINPEYIAPDFLETLNFDDFQFGVDARFNLTVLEVNALAAIEPIVDTLGNFGGGMVAANLGAGVSIPLLDIVRFGLFAGPSLSFIVSRSGFEPGEDFPLQPGDIFASNLFVRVTADVMLGALSVGGTYIVDTNTNLNSIFDEGFDPAVILENPVGRAGFSVLFALF